MVTCPQCSNEYTEIGKHFYKSNCTYPTLSAYQRDLITGVLMGDGCIDRFSSENPSFIINITNREYLEYIYDKLGIYSSNLSLYRTAEECAESTGKRLVHASSDPDRYRDSHRYTTISSPELMEFADWYGTNGKVFPKNIDLSPTILLHWFVCDGTYDNTGTQNRITISLSNERRNKKKIEEYFYDALDIETILWNESERVDGSISTNIFFTVDQSRKIFEYISNSPDHIPPGFEYKFPQ